MDSLKPPKPPNLPQTPSIPAPPVPEEWTESETLNGKFYRYVDTGVNLPLIEISEANLAQLAGRRHFEPYWVVAEHPVVFAVYDRDHHLIFGPQGFDANYSLTKLIEQAGYGSEATFRAQFAPSTTGKPLTDLEIWVRLGLPVKVFLPSLPPA